MSAPTAGPVLGALDDPDSFFAVIGATPPDRLFATLVGGRARDLGAAVSPIGELAETLAILACGAESLGAPLAGDRSEDAVRLPPTPDDCVGRMVQVVQDLLDLGALDARAVELAEGAPKPPPIPGPETECGSSAAARDALLGELLGCTRPPRLAEETELLVVDDPAAAFWVLSVQLFGTEHLLSEASRAVAATVASSTAAENLRALADSPIARAVGPTCDGALRRIETALGEQGWRAFFLRSAAAWTARSAAALLEDFPSGWVRYGTAGFPLRWRYASAHRAGLEAVAARLTMPGLGAVCERVSLQGAFSPSGAPPTLFRTMPDARGTS